MKNLATFVFLGLALVGCGPMPSTADSGPSPDVRTPPPPPPDGSAGPVCSQISGEYALMAAVDPAMNDCSASTMGAPETFAGTLTISNVTEAGFDMAITYTSGDTPTTVTCTGNLNSSCVYMGRCSVPGGEMGETDGATFTVDGANRRITGRMLVKGQMGCSTRYAVTATGR